MQKILGLVLILFCRNLFALVDPDATQSTLALYEKLRAASGNYIYYGEYLPWGIGKEIHTYKITGKLPTIFMTDYSSTVDVGFKFNQQRQAMTKHYLSGGIIIMTWTMNNFITGGTCRDDTSDPVVNILPGGSHRDTYLAELDLFADKVKKIGIPIIFRPFPECDGTWFYWGDATDEQFKTLWYDLIVYLRDVKGVHNLLYMFNPEILTGTTFKIGRFPGSEWADIYGVDRYTNANTISNVLNVYRYTAQSAIEDDKPWGVVEGLRKLTDYPKADFWTWYFNQLLADSLISTASFVCNWSAPAWGCKVGRSDEASFLEMSQNPKIKFLEKKKGIIISGVTTK